MISIIIPVYKVEKYIFNCISSVLNQTYFDYEIVLVNDGTPDESVRIARDLLEHQQKIPYRIITTENQGVSAARNIGVKNANGEFLIMVDADDIISHTFLQDYYEAIQRHPNCNIYSFGFTVVSEKNQLSFFNDAKGEILLSPEQSQLCFYNRTLIFLLPTVMLRTSYLRENRILFDEEVRYSEDVQFIWRCLAYNKKEIVHCEKSNYKYVLHHGSTMTASSIEKILTFCGGLDRLSMECGELLCDPIGKLLKSRMYFSVLHGAAKMMSYKDFLSLYKKANCRQYIKAQTRSGKVIHRLPALCLLISKRLGYTAMRMA